jgi:hypothetical protein
MKRYDIDSQFREGGLFNPGLKELPNGRWVSYDDAIAEINALKAELSVLKSPSVHEDDLAVDEFAAKMKDKLAYSREVKGRHGWKTANSAYLAQLLIKHVEKGDPVDIANFCMMLEHLRPRNNGPIKHAWEAEHAALKAPPKVLSAEEVKEPGCYWWRREENTDWSVQNVYLPGAGKLLVGQFIGPIQSAGGFQDRIANA